MIVTIKFFATYRQATGLAQTDCTVAEAATVADLIGQLEQTYPALQGALQTQALVAVNEQYARREQPLQPRDTIAVFPPVSGG
jgi:sulfur-carrier protein